MPRPVHVPHPARPATGRSATVEIAVVGDDIVGAAVAWQLARRGHEVVLLDRSEPGHTRSAVHPSTRGYRQTHTDPRRVALAVEALGLWREVEHETGASLLHLTGGIDHGTAERTAALADSLAAHGISHQWLDPDAAADRWPGMAFAGPVLHQPDRAGRLRTHQSATALTAAAIGFGATVRRSTPVDRVTVAGPDLVEIETPAGTVRARRAVVVAGVRTAALVGGLLDLPPLQLTRDRAARFPARGSTPCDPLTVDWPTFGHHRSRGGEVRGLPGRSGGVTLTLRAADPTGTAAGLDRLQEYVSAYLPGLDPDRPEPLECRRVTTPDSAFVLDRTGPLVVGAGFGADGFPFAPALGRLLADLATGPLPAPPATARCH